jgi:L-arabinonolactonase
MFMRVDIAFHTKDSLGEGPVWSVDDHALFWVDILKPALQCWYPETGHFHSWEMPSDIGSFAVRESGGFIVALRTGLAIFEPEDGELGPICDPEADKPFTRFNDGKCDRQGRFWVGTMDEELPNQRGALYCLEFDYLCRKIRSDVGISNGLGWSPDNRVMYYTDSAKHTIYRSDFDLETGEITNEEIFARTPQEYVPDGLTVDAEGYVWSANWDGWKVIRYTPDGLVDLEVKLPVQRPTSCSFGGPGMTQLFITTARIGLSEDQLIVQPLAGSVLVVETGIRGLPEPCFAG